MSPPVAGVHAGLAGEAERLRAELAAQPATAGPGRVHVFDLFAEGTLFPVAEWLGDADLVLAGAGYNSYWEAHWLGWAPCTRFTAFARKMDDQQWRLASCAGHAMRENGADALARLVLAG